MATSRKLQALLQTIPEVREALARIPGVREHLACATGRRVAIWSPDDRADVTNKIYAAALQLEIEQLRADIKETIQKYDTVQRAQKNWKLLTRARDRIVLQNEAGEMAQIPSHIVQLLTAGRSFDGEIEDGGDHVRFVHEGTVVCELPKSLAMRLDAVLKEVCISR